MEYLHEFNNLARYAPEDVREDEEKQEKFLAGMDPELSVRLVSGDYPDFQRLVEKSIRLEAKHKELDSSSNHAPCPDLNSWCASHSCSSSRISKGPVRPVLLRPLCSLVKAAETLKVAAAQAQQAPKTDPVEAAALNTILGRWGKKASPEWNISGELCSGFATDKTDWDYYPNINPFIKCDCTDSNNTLCHITRLGIGSNNFTGGLPEELELNLEWPYLLSNMIIFQTFNNRYIDSSGFSGPFPSSFSKLQNLNTLYSSDNGFNGKIPEYLGTITNLVEIALYGNSFEGPIPESLSNLAKLKTLRIGDIVNGISPLAFISNMTSLSTIILRNCKISSDLGAIDFSKFEHLELLDLSFNNITGEVPQSILNLGNLKFLFLGNNSLTGRLPDGISSSLKAIDFSYNQLTGSFPSWASQNNLQLNLVANNFLLESTSDSTLPWGLNCLQQDTPCFRGSPKYYSFAVDCGSNGSTRGSDDTIYEADPTNLGAATYYVTDFTPTVRNGIPKRESKAGAISGILIGAIVLVLAALFGVFTLIKKRRALAQQKEELYNLVGRPDVFSYAELKLATDNFNSQNILGEGGFGPVYKGKLPDERVIAVKQLSQSSHQGTSQFVTEVATISAVQHRNLVILHGCCIDSKTPLLVYEYLENGSLDRAIFAIYACKGDSNLNLDWVMRFEIILGIARGLIYLHEESSIRIVHRDIKASNVLLDTNLVPKISDFGLAKLYDENQTHVSTRIAGTLGYLAPEYAMRGHLSEKADIFAFGVVMLETVAGRPNTDNSLEESKICLLEWAWGLYEKDQALGIVDPSLKEFGKDEAFRAICVALVCTQGSPHQRPPMSKVVAMLTGDVDVAKVVTKPSYITEWQLRGGGNSSNTTSS
ncbi:probable LRR receptor-like serine/threonine-protein kinase At1g56140 [Oryza sativa Japonica Group]|uniref:probable LRR receptor-like serine/threonine-protein kinase At1g56140 n=1 Tax=Oryza sativa subsp. japonica TaxID=39947 RepID=UPI00339C9EC8